MAEKTQHTPAPWVFKTMGGNKKIPVIAAPNGKKKKHELFETVARFNEKSVNEANANLIAAAPELLEALESMVAVADAKMASQTIRARKVIAKARGEQ